MLKPVLIGGIVCGILAGIPIVNCLNACCLLYILAGVITAHMMINNGEKGLGNFAVAGGLSGTVAGIIGGILSFIFSLIMNVLSTVFNLSTDSGMHVSEGILGIGASAAGGIIGIIFAVIFGAISGAIGSVVYSKIKGI
jgi:hypothetical protein